MNLGKSLLALGCVALIGCTAATQVASAGVQDPQAPTPTPSPDGGKVEGKGYAAVQKILNVHCVGCHSEKGRAGFDARTYESIMKGYEDGVLVTPGNVEKSPLALSLRGKGGYRKMPTKRGIPLSEAQIVAVEQWIKDGAKKTEPAS